MALEARSPGILRFGTLEVELRSGELRKKGVRIKLQDQPFQVLKLLLQRSGELVTREELRTQIWSADTFVDFDNGLNTSINKLREALGDSADSPRFIETLPRRGYRFIAPVTSDGGESGLATAVAGAKSERHWRRIALVALIVIGGIGAGGMVWRSRQGRRLTEKDTIVLADFTNTTGDPVFDDTLKQGLRVQLEQSPFLNILSDEKVSEELQMMGRQKNERITVSLAREVCQRAGSKVFLVGSISSLGTHYAIGMNAFNCHTGDSLGSQQVEAESREHVLKAVGQSATKMREKLGESLATIQRYDAPVEQATTTSLEAFEAYTLGIDTWSAKGEKAAIPFFQRAVELDPKFAMAYARLGVLATPGPSSAENVRKAYELRGKVTERERLYIEGHYYRDVTGEQDKAASIWEMMRQTYRQEDEAYTNLARYYARRGNYEMALGKIQEAVRLYPEDQDNLSALARIYMCLNRLPEAEEVLKHAEKRNLEGEKLLNVRYLLAFLKGDTGEMQRLVATSADKDGAENFHIWQAHAEAYHGKLMSARKLLRPEKRNCGETCVDLSLIEAYFGDAQKARLDAEAAMKSNVKRDGYIPVLTLALASALAGDLTRAEKLSADVDRDEPLSTEVQRDWLPTIRAAMALAHKDADKAVELLGGISPYEMGVVRLIPRYERGLAYLMLHNGSAAAPEFQKIVDHPAIVGISPIGALAHLGLARAYALQGDTTKSRAAYHDFFTLWKDADPDVPILREAKTECAKLE
jgi:DNA-binding winged helix-turn-helix (wHTH) protein/tetratricopeptide (TPR) repeat protein